MSRVLMITTDYPPIRGGISSMAWHLAVDLSRRGHEVEVVAPAWTGHLNHDPEDPCRVFRTPGYGLGYLRGLPLLARAFSRLVLRPPDLVLPMNVGYGGLAMALLRAMGIRVPYAMFAYGLEFARFRGSPLMRRLYRRVYEQALRVWAVSDDTRRRLEEFGVRRTVEVLYPGVELDRFSPEGPDFRHLLNLEGRPVLGTISRLVERKGHDLVLRALPRVLEAMPDACYLVVGSGPDRSRLEALAGQLGVASAVHFVGEANEEALADWLRTFDVFVLASREIPASGHVEGFGIVLLEAGACGVPVIGGRSGGVVEAVEDQVSGLLVDPRDPDDLARALLELLGRPDRARALGAAGRRRVEERFTWEHVLAPVAGLLESLPGSPRPPR